MLYKNAFLFPGDKPPFLGSFRVEDGIFTEVLDCIPDEEGVDLESAWVIPGLVDIHTHGNSGADFSDGSYEGLLRMGAYLAAHGITSFAPASMTLPDSTLSAAFQAAARLHREAPAGVARLMGIHMEGPFFSERKKGAQNGAFLRPPDVAAFRALYEDCGGLIRIVDVAPELEGAAAFTRSVRSLCTVSIAHTDATYEQAAAVLDEGASHLTHLFNAMPPIHHRRPGVIGAASERDTVTAELICDGLHIHPSAVRMAFRLFPDRICLISDALRCCGMPDGRYTLGGQEVFLQGGIARLADGTIAGSATNLYDCMRNAVSFGIPIQQAVRAATFLPAREIGAAEQIGSIAPGRLSDFVVCDSHLRRKAVYLGGLLLDASTPED